jgi:hypothetical protein
MTERIRTRIHTISDDGYLITLVPVADGLTVPNPPPKEFVTACMTNHNYVVLETNVFNILMNLGVSPSWNIDTRSNRPIVWNSATQRNYFVARLVADARLDETVTCIDGNNFNLRYINLEKKRKKINPPDRRDREDIVKPDSVEPIKDIVTYQNYSQPTYSSL